MFGWITSLLSFLFKIWDNVPPQTKEDIKKKIMEWFEEILRQYYRSQQSKTED